MEKAELQGQTWFVYIYLPLKEVNIHIHFICLDRNFDHPQINVVSFVPRKQPKKPQFFPQNMFFC